jgi:hypothetical protein
MAGSMSADAQTPAAAPAAPAVAAPAVAAPAAQAAQAAPAAPNNLWGFLLPTRQQLKDCREEMAEHHRKCCESQVGQLLNNSLKSLSLASGGLIGPLCPETPKTPGGASEPNKDDLAKPPDSAQGAAARIKQQEVEAAERRDAVRFLGTVDCQRFPEAEAALIKALREDTNECVRWEAAKALGNGCCCTKKTLEALTLTVNGSQKDGNPTEKSERVRSAAYDALLHCLACYEEKPEEGEKPEKPEKAKPAAGKDLSKILPAYYLTIDAEPGQQVADAARRTLVLHAERSGQTAPGQRHLSAIVARAAVSHRPALADERFLAESRKPIAKRDLPAPATQQQVEPQQAPARAPRSLVDVIRKARN